MTDTERLGTLLARIHGDGGHYQGLFGTEKAVKDADAKIVALRVARDSLHESTSRLIPLLGSRLRGTPTYTQAIDALARSAMSGCEDSIRMSYASEVETRVAEIRKKEAAAPDWAKS